MKIKYYDRDIIYMKNGGISTSGLKANLISFKEINRIYKKHKVKFRWFIQMKRIVIRLLQFNLVRKKR